MQHNQTFTYFKPPHNVKLVEPMQKFDIEIVPKRPLILRQKVIKEEGNKFRIRRQFSNFSPLMKGSTFALGRGELRQQGIMGGIQDTPGPGYYPTREAERGFNYTISTKMKDISQKYKSTIPPLGQYELPGLDRYGYYYISCNKNSRAPIFTDPQLERFQYKYNANPGPGEYNIPDAVHQRGYLSPQKY